MAGLHDVFKVFLNDVLLVVVTDDPERTLMSPRGGGG
jgi:hypothetical protein